MILGGKIEVKEGWKVGAWSGGVIWIGGEYISGVGERVGMMIAAWTNAMGVKLLAANPVRIMAESSSREKVAMSASASHLNTDLLIGVDQSSLFYRFLGMKSTPGCSRVDGRLPGKDIGLRAGVFRVAGVRKLPVHRHDHTGRTWREADYTAVGLGTRQTGER